MKKFLSVALCLLLVLSLGACKKGGDPNEIFISTESTTKSENDIKDTVKVSFPLSVVEEEYQNNLDAYCEKYGYKSAKRNSDGTVTVKMSAFSYEMLMTQKGMAAIKGIYNVAEDGKYPYVKGIESYDEKNFAAVSVLVEKAKYDKASNTGDMTFELAKACREYQLVAGRTFAFTVTVVDSKTKKAVETREYSDADFAS